MGKYEFSGPFDYLNHHLSDFAQVPFFNAQDAEIEYVWPIDPLRHRFIAFTTFFETFRRQIMSSKGHSPT
jgi:hypothetical protein